MGKFKRFRKENLKSQYDFYSNNLSNFRTVLKDTKGKVARTENGIYNCMSYALGVFNDWLDLDEFTWSDDGDELEIIASNCAAELEDYGCRPLNSHLDHLEEGERMIAMRIGHDDFHFARLNSDGIWTHKTGGGTIKVMSEEELLGDCWCSSRMCPYISTVYFFAIKGDIKIWQHLI